MNEMKGLSKESQEKRSRRSFSEDFQRDAVRLVVEEKYTFAAAAKAVGVTVKSLRTWHKRFAPPPESCGENATVEELREENRRLRRELRRADMEREILKKATAYFAKESLLIRLDSRTLRLLSRGRHVRCPGRFDLRLLRGDRSTAKRAGSASRANPGGGSPGPRRVARHLRQREGGRSARPTRGPGIGLSQHGRGGDAGNGPEKPGLQAFHPTFRTSGFHFLRISLGGQVDGRRSWLVGRSA